MVADKRSDDLPTCTKAQVEAWMWEARAGSREALGKLLDAYRCYLIAIANEALPQNLQAKLSSSDLVQDTALEAHRGFKNFRGVRANDFEEWINTILRNNAANVRRHYEEARKRAVELEKSWGQALPTNEELHSP